MPLKPNVLKKALSVGISPSNNFVYQIGINQGIIKIF